MSVQTLSIAPDNSSDASFRAWGSAISTAIAAVGLVQTADTGQINWTTVTHPTTGSSKKGYEIWRFADSLQSTSPVFIRLDYGSNTLSAGVNPQIWFTIGTASDGAGNITASGSFPSALLSVQTIMCDNSSQWNSPSVSSLYVDSDGAGSLLIAGWCRATGAGFLTLAGAIFAVERSRNWDGTTNGEGIIAYGMKPNNTSSGNSSAAWHYQMTITNSAAIGQGSYANNAVTFPSLESPDFNTGAAGSNLYFFPIFTGFTPKMNAPSKHIVAVRQGDLAANVQFPLTTYGVSHTWQAWGVEGTQAGQAGGSATVSMAWRIT